MTETKKDVHVGIVGAGIGGLTAAIAIAQAGAKVTVLEAAEELGEVRFSLPLPQFSNTLSIPSITQPSLRRTSSTLSHPAANTTDPARRRNPNDAERLAAAPALRRRPHHRAEPRVLHSAAHAGAHRPADRVHIDPTHRARARRALVAGAAGAPARRAGGGGARARRDAAHGIAGGIAGGRGVRPRRGAHLRRPRPHLRLAGRRRRRALRRAARAVSGDAAARPDRQRRVPHSRAVRALGG